MTPEFQTTCSALKIFDTAECGNYVGGLNENSLISFGPLTAAALDADYQVISCSGSGNTKATTAPSLTVGLTAPQWVPLVSNSYAL